MKFHFPVAQLVSDTAIRIKTRTITLVFRPEDFIFSSFEALTMGPNLELVADAQEEHIGPIRWVFVGSG